MIKETPNSKEELSEKTRKYIKDKQKVQEL